MVDLGGDRNHTIDQTRDFILEDVVPANGDGLLNYWSGGRATVSVFGSGAPFGKERLVFKLECRMVGAALGLGQFSGAPVSNHPLARAAISSDAILDRFLLRRGC